LSTDLFGIRQDRKVRHVEPPRQRLVCDLVLAAGLSKEELAAFLEVPPHELRYWCDGTKPVPRMAILALERLVQLGRQVQSPD